MNSRSPQFSLRHTRQFARLSVLIWLLQKGTPADAKRLAALKLDEDQPEFRRIRCPACKWQPPAHMRWCCSDCDAPEFYYGGCGTIWHTFDTHGICPGCQHQWRWTKCFQCNEWTLHEDWYTNEPD